MPKMTYAESIRFAKKLAEFCALMQGGEGLASKAPSYLLEKFESCDGSGWSLDGVNMPRFKNWLSIWASHLRDDA